MSSTQPAPAPAREIPFPKATTVPLKLEVVTLPVSDIDRSKRFYESLGWRLDADFHNGDWRGVQMTPPGSACSVHFGTSIMKAAPGSVQGLFLVVDDVEAARADLIAHGVEVSEPFHFTTPGSAPVPGIDPERRSYFSYAAFTDPDGNGFLLQEVTTRLPGRGLPLNVATLTELLKETEIRHGEFESSPTTPKHHWSDWYAAYITAREQGRTPEEAAAIGADNVARVIAQPA